MKNNFINFGLALIFILGLSVFSNVFGQQGTGVLPFEEGKVLSSADISFLNLIYSDIGKTATSRGASAEISIGSSKVKEGSKISKDDAESIKKAIQKYNDANEKHVTNDSSVSPEASRGAQQYCGYYCYYYYWDYYCACYRYYWYYCCV